MAINKQSVRTMYLLGLLIAALSVLIIIYTKTDIRFVLFGNQKIKGRILSQEKKPIQGALVAVQSGTFDGPGSPGPVIVRTNEAGIFEAQIRSGDYIINAWKEGYAENGCNAEEYCAENSEISIELRKIDTTLSLPTNDDFYDLQKRNGFSFNVGRVVDKKDLEADIIFELDKDDALQLVIKAKDGGGIAYELFSRNVDFDNTPVAPEKYEGYLNIDLHPNSIFFVKTHDGNYAKFRAMPVINSDGSGNKILDLSNVRIIWAYQPDGSRNLETASAVKPPVVFDQIN